jgi:hypothetical protein
MKTTPVPTFAKNSLPQGTAATDSNDPAGTTASVVKGTINETYDFGFKPPFGTVTGDLYYDVDGNGTRGPGEPNLTNVNVTITVCANVVTVSTDGSDNYSAQVLPGSASVDVDNADPDFTSQVPPGYTQTEGTDPTVVTGTAGATTSAGNDGYYTPATVTGHLYYDTNGNGVQEAGEPNLTNVTVTVTSGTNIVLVTTDAAGNWTASVPPGSVSADLDNTDADFIAQVPAGYSQTEGTDPTTVTAAAGAPTSAGNDGYYTPATVTGHLYYDTNGNGTQQAGEPNLTNVTVTVTSGTNIVLATTDSAGNWTALVPPGSVTADVLNTDPDFLAQVPAVHQQTEGTDPTTVTAVAGTVTDAGNDGYTSQYVDGYVYIDSVSLGTVGQYDPGVDLPIPFVTVWITNSQGGLVIAYTDANGYFNAYVPSGNTVVNVDTNDFDFPYGLVLTSAPDGENPSTVTVPPGGSARDNTGYRRNSFTLASILSVTAQADAGVVTVRWVSAAEVGTVAYDLQRQTASGHWTTVNVDPVFALNSIVGGSYAVVDAEARARQTYQYQILEHLENGDTKVHGPYAVTVTGEPGVPVTITSLAMAGAQLRLSWQGEAGSTYRALHK